MGCFGGHRSVSLSKYKPWTDDANVFEWVAQIRTCFQALNIPWKMKYDLLMRDVYHAYNSDIPFHNRRHAYDVFQLGVCLFHRNASKMRGVSSLRKFTYCLALLCHDADHRGYTNQDVEENGDLAYDDTEDDDVESMCSERSYNEKHHISYAKRLVHKHGVDMDTELFTRLISKTDLTINKRSPNDVVNTPDDMMVLFVQLADVGHVLRPWDVHLSFVCALNRERPSPLSAEDLPEDTLRFNRTFVVPLLSIINTFNTRLVLSLWTRYKTNKRQWGIVSGYFSEARRTRTESRAESPRI
jgi:hypothetical protein